MNSIMKWRGGSSSCCQVTKKFICYMLVISTFAQTWVFLSSLVKAELQMRRTDEQCRELLSRHMDRALGLRTLIAQMARLLLNLVWGFFPPRSHLTAKYFHSVATRSWATSNSIPLISWPFWEGGFHPLSLHDTQDTREFEGLNYVRVGGKNTGVK